jgi:hypothetical protein
MAERNSPERSEFTAGLAAPRTRSGRLHKRRGPHGGTLTTPNGREISELVPVVEPLTIRKWERLEEPSAALLHSNYVDRSATKSHVMPCAWKGLVTIWRRTFGSHARSTATRSEERVILSARAGVRSPVTGDTRTDD